MTLLVSMTLCGIIGLLRIISPNYELFCIVEFLDAFVTSGTYFCGYILAAELVVPKYRPWIVSIFNTFYCCGHVLVALVAWIFRDWRMIIYIIYIPSTFSILFHWLIPESIRWNASKGKLDEATKTLKNFTNKKTIPRTLLHSLHRSILHHEEENREISFGKLVKSTTLLVRLINSCVLWMSSLLVYNGLIIYSVALSSSPYLNVCLLSFAEIVTYFTIPLFVEKLRRKTCLISANILCAVSCIACIFIENKLLYVLIYCFGKFGSTLNYFMVAMVTIEIFPTPLRHTTLATCTMVGRLGDIISPQMTLLGHLWKPLPVIVFAFSAVISGTLSFFLPETLNVKLPDTIEEAENIGKIESNET